MWWKKNKELHEWMVSISARLTDVQLKLDEMGEKYEKDNFARFETYMKNVDKLNTMINELKGCVTMTRSAIGEGRALTAAIQQVEHIANISQGIHKAMAAFIQSADKLEHDAHYKVDYIYKNVEEIADFLHKCEKKSRKEPKSTKKKKSVSQASLSE